MVFIYATLLYISYHEVLFQIRVPFIFCLLSLVWLSPNFPFSSITLIPLVNFLQTSGFVLFSFIYIPTMPRDHKLHSAPFPISHACPLISSGFLVDSTTSRVWESSADQNKMATLSLLEIIAFCTTKKKNKQTYFRTKQGHPGNKRLGKG